VAELEKVYNVPGQELNGTVISDEELGQQENGNVM
jgi:hypothetical protein